MKESSIEKAAAPPMTQTLYTFVIAITPMFSPYVVVGQEPHKPDKAVEKPSANIER